MQAVVALAGFIALWYQIRDLKLAVHSDTQAKLYEHYTQVVGMILERPHLRPHLYKDVAVPGETQEAATRRRELDSMCEIMAGLLEHGLLQKRNLPNKAWKECWQPAPVPLRERQRKLVRQVVPRHSASRDKTSAAVVTQMADGIITYRVRNYSALMPLDLMSAE